MPGAQVGIAQGATGGKFNVIDHRGLGANPFNISTTVTPDIGALMIYVAGSANRVAIASGDSPATVQYAGFCDPKVISDYTGLAIYVHGELALVNQDHVGIWYSGRYKVALVSGVVADNALVYPADGGKLSATKVGSSPAVGIARKGNAGVANGVIEVEIDLIGHGS